jgi:hypothetical protein
VTVRIEGDGALERGQGLARVADHLMTHGEIGEERRVLWVFFEALAAAFDGFHPACRGIAYDRVIEPRSRISRSKGDCPLHGRRRRGVLPGLPQQQSGIVVGAGISGLRGDDLAVAGKRLFDLVPLG